jgi:hypothetical protein
MTGAATPVGSFSADSVGAGLLDAVGAVGSLPKVASGGTVPPPIPVTPTVNTSNTPKNTSVNADVPDTRISRRPGRVVRARHNWVRVSFRFGATQSNVTFLCQFDGGLRHRCLPRTFHRFFIGEHTVTVAARNQTGGVDPTPAVYRFRIERID